MSYTIGWKDGHATVTTAEEAEVALDQIAAAGRGPMLMHVAPDDGRETLIEMVWGDPERAMLMYADPHGGGWAIEPGMPPATKDLGYDYGAIEPDRTRLSAKAARTAVAEYVATGRRPTSVNWME